MSSNPLFSISDPIELLALWRLVAEAKFQPCPDDHDLWHSPYVHGLAQKISDALLDYERQRGNIEGVERHNRWIASLPDNIVLPVVKAQLRKDASQSWWSKKSYPEKVAYVKGCVAPFEPGESFIEELIREAEAV